MTGRHLRGINGGKRSMDDTLNEGVLTDTAFSSVYAGRGMLLLQRGHRGRRLLLAEVHRIQAGRELIEELRRGGTAGEHGSGQPGAERRRIHPAHERRLTSESRQFVACVATFPVDAHLLRQLGGQGSLKPFRC